MAKTACYTPDTAMIVFQLVQRYGCAVYARLGRRFKTVPAAIKCAAACKNPTYILREGASHPAWARPDTPLEIRASVR